MPGWRLVGDLMSGMTRSARVGDAGRARLRLALVLGALAAYSATLLIIELTTSQAYVRPWFTEIDGDVMFYAVNTSLSVALLAGAALLLLFAAAVTEDDPAGRDARPFLVSQAVMLALFAFDDRFQLHERLGWRLGIGDHFVLLGWAAIEMLLLALFCRPRHLTVRAVVLFCAGSALFLIMLAIDALVPAMTVGRLSVEDLAKTWGGAMMFGFGWETAQFHIRKRSTRAEPLSHLVAP